MIIRLEQDSPEWLEYRKTKFNASEAGDVMGVGFNKPYQLAQIKYQGKQVYQNEAMRQGKEYEGQIRDYVNQKYNLSLSPVVICSDRDSRFSASLDGYDIFTDAFCEIKFSRNEYEYFKEHGKPSEKYFWQIQHQFYVSEAKKCLYAVGFIGDMFEIEVEVIEVERDDKAIKKLIKAWNEFEATYKNNDLDNEWLELSDELVEAMERKRELEDKIEQLKARVLEKAGEVEMKAYGLTIYKTERKPSYDYKSYCEHSGAIIPDEYLKAGSVSWGVRVC
ncbi:lambda-exonuclease family protein [Campylobacter sp. RM16192]|uniref:lambda-exonuclease family protein n=1 Tax=Campylobacter sp. RM16192 TaxID=1660080 RepID=UPI001451887D|nr:YqaJ viral recombinase family protein [Campylobacter sp. RM16192]QCD52836.1 YqaJ-like viral recombinase domain protein [Campylobacter sp. RM16192]